jgi:hypothetical protein
MLSSAHSVPRDGQWPVVAVYVLAQTPDGSWYAEAGGGHRVTNISGWQQIAQLLASDAVRWSDATDEGRFRAQFGPPPAALSVQVSHDDPGD